MARVSQLVRRILKWCGIAVAGVIGLVVLLIVSALAINAHDESLTPQAQALLVAPPNPDPPEDNLYFAILGIDAPAGASATLAGQAKVEEFNRSLPERLRDPSMESLTAAPQRTPGGLEFQGKFAFAIKSYWRDVPAHRAEVEQLLAANRELLERYEDLHHRHGYCDTAQPSLVGAPLAFVPGDLRSLYLAQMVLQLQASEPRVRRQALDDLHDDVATWQTVLTGQGTLVSTMLAIAYLHWDELVLADAIADPGFALPLEAQDAERIAPLFALGDWNIGRAFAAEFRAQDAMLRQTARINETGGFAPPDPDAGPLRRALQGAWAGTGAPFFKLHATENLFAAMAARRMRQADFSAAAAADAGAEPSLVNLRMIYNPGGKGLATLVTSFDEQYPARAADGAAFQRLLRLAYEIRRQQVATAAIPAFLAQHPQWSTHPAGGRPFIFDAGSGEIRVPTVARQPPKRAFSVPVWKGVPGG